MTLKTLSVSLAVVCALATQAAGQSKTLSSGKDTGPAPFQTFGTKQSEATPYGQVVPTWNCDGPHGDNSCQLVILWCEKDFGCTEL